MKQLIAFMALVLATTSYAELNNPKPNNVAVSGAWARATPPNAKAAAVYFTLRTADGDALVGASSPAAERVEIHETVMYPNGMMEMQYRETVELTQNTVYQFKPHSYHVMLLGLYEPLQAGYELPLTLEFATAGRKVVRVPIQPLTYQP